MKFQSTHSLRSATTGHGPGPPEEGFQSTHSLRSATHLVTKKRNAVQVSIHALLAECDAGKEITRNAQNRFNPRTPCGVRRVQKYPQGPIRGVSIHALLAECDGRRFPSHAVRRSFNPRTPCGVRLPERSDARLRRKFQSTHSLRSATGKQQTPSSGGNVSIHALLAECDFHPGGHDHDGVVSIHALLAECDAL